MDECPWSQSNTGADIIVGGVGPDKFVPFRLWTSVSQKFYVSFQSCIENPGETCWKKGQSEYEQNLTIEFRVGARRKFF